VAGRTVETLIPTIIDRNFPIDVFATRVKALQDSGVVDTIQMWDQLTSWYPRSLWTPERTAMARFVPDCDSFADWFQMSAYAAAIAPSMRTAVSVDALRRGAPELVQSMLTLANITEGKATFHVGAGELKQAQPFGYDLSKKLGRLSDFYKIFHKFWDSTGPIDFEGRYTTLDQAWLGVARRHRPKIYGLGGGPKVIELATSYADGFATLVPMVWANPDRMAAQVKTIREQLERKGRDPDKFEFCVYAAALVSDDENKIDKALDHHLTRWHSLIWGRINQADWEDEGLAPPMGRDWHYSTKLLPVNISGAEADELLKRVTRQHAEKTWIWGTPQKVAGDLQAYIDAGATAVGILDVMFDTLAPEEALASVQPSIEVCRLLKAANG
jgi:phthiodiolone/phenolphthiodiolone dimycocerosates ketoreductase